MLLSSQQNIHNDSELLGSCTFPGVCLHVLSRVSLRSQARYSVEGTSRAHKSHRATRQVGETGAAQCSCVQHVTASLPKKNHALFPLHDPRGPSLSSPTPSLSYKSDKYSAMMADVIVGSTLGVLFTTSRSSQSTPRTAGRGWKCH